MRKGEKPTNNATIRIAFRKSNKDFLTKKANKVKFGIYRSLNYLKNHE